MENAWHTFRLRPLGRNDGQLDSQPRLLETYSYRVSILIRNARTKQVFTILQDNLTVHPVINIEYFQGYNQNSDCFGPRCIQERGSRAVNRRDSRSFLAARRSCWYIMPTLLTMMILGLNALSIGSQAMVDEYMLRNKDVSSPKSARQDRIGTKRERKQSTTAKITRGFPRR
jgi:hypothetical protein